MSITCFPPFQVKLTLRTNRLGRIQIPLGIRVQGSKNKLEAIIEARSRGPTIEFGAEEPRSNTAAIAFGKVPVLKVSAAVALRLGVNCAVHPQWCTGCKPWKAIAAYGGCTRAATLHWLQVLESYCCLRRLHTCCSSFCTPWATQVLQQQA